MRERSMVRLPRSARRSRPRRSVVAALLLVTVAVVASACSSSGSGSNKTSAATSSVPANSGLASMLPASIRSAGVLKIGTQAYAAPMDYTDNSGNPIGADIDLAKALASSLGLKAQFTVTNFNGLIPGSLAGRWDLIWASMNDTALRQQQITFVDYFKSSTTVIVQKGNPKNITSTADFCGLTFGEQQGSAYQPILATLSQQKCAGKKPIVIQTFPDFATVYSAIAVGRVDAALQSLEGNAYEAKQTPTLETPNGIQLDPVHYGIGIDPKNAQLIKAVQAAMNQMIKDGTYKNILAKWGLTAGAVPTAALNQNLGQ